MPRLFGGTILLLACAACAATAPRPVEASRAPSQAAPPPVTPPQPQPQPSALTAAPPRALRSADAFQAIGDRAARARALFLEASRVFLHPRCTGCHPDGDSPYQAQGAALVFHDPPVLRGRDDQGVPGMRCTGCHQDRNLPLARVPGAPRWRLAPRSMAWVGRSPRAVCEQMKDPARNGGRTLAQIVDHNAHDALVGWGFAPGWGREPAPGTQDALGRLVAAWVEAGADCPPEEARP